MESSLEDNKDIKKNKELAAVSYAWIMGLVVFLARKESKFAQFHARQATILFILSIIFWFIPYIGRFLEIPVFIAMLIGFIMAFQGIYFPIPIIKTLGDCFVLARIKDICQKWWSCAINLMKKIITKRKEEKVEFPMIEKMKQLDQNKEKDKTLEKGGVK